MKKLLNLSLSLLFVLGSSLLTSALAQDLKIGYWRANDQRGINVFEPTKDMGIDYTGLQVNLGGHFTQQFQGLSHSNTPFMDNSGEIPVDLNALGEINSGFNLATANLNIDVQLEDGVRLHLITYLSSRHHTEAWVKGGYIQFDKLAFLNSSFLDDVMQYVTVKVGHMEINYGDAHFRRTDNANSMYNPFVGNNIMDAFSTEIGGEVYFQADGFLAMVAATNGELKGSITGGENRSPAIYGKVGYDKQVSEDLRLRLTGSVYHLEKNTKARLYGGDRSGSRFYSVMEASDFSGRFNPSLNNQLTAMMINPFVKLRGLEVFGTYERAVGGTTAEVEAGEERVWNQYAIDVLYRLLPNESLFVGGRYNLLEGELLGSTLVDNAKIDRMEIGGGWFITKNVLLKAEYVRQQYIQGFPEDNLLNGGEFKGYMIEAAVGF